MSILPAVVVALVDSSLYSDNMLLLLLLLLLSPVTVVVVELQSVCDCNNQHLFH